MNKLWFVIRREYVVRVHSRMFVLTTVGIPVFLIAVFAVPTYLASRHSGHTLKIAILDEAGGMASVAKQGLSLEKLPNQQPTFVVISTLEMPSDPTAAGEQLRKQVESGALDGYLLIPAKFSEDSTAQAEFHTRNPGDFTLKSSLSRGLSQAAVLHRLQLEKIQVADVSALLKPADVGIVRITKQGEAEEKGESLQAAILLAGILYFCMLMYGINTMRSIIEEKASRIMEILLSSVRPFLLLSGKILGVGAVGLTQFLIWAGAGAAFVAYSSVIFKSFDPSSSGLSLHMPPALWFWFLVYFIGGYFLYSSIYAAVGASVSSEQDANQLQFPITMLLVLAFILFPVVMRDPGSTGSILLSMVPFFSPILMILRVAMETPPLWQILLSVALLVLTTVGVIYISAKIYRVGVLMYGKRPSLIELVRWLRYS